MAAIICSATTTGLKEGLAKSDRRISILSLSVTCAGSAFWSDRHCDGNMQRACLLPTEDCDRRNNYMAKRKRNWMWRRLAEGPTKERRPTNYRRPDFMLNKHGQTVRQHCPHPTTPAIERFVALTERRLVGDDYCVVWKGGDTFRVDDETVTTPARFYWKIVTGEKLKETEALYRACKTPRCVKHKVKR